MGAAARVRDNGERARGLSEEMLKFAEHLSELLAEEFAAALKEERDAGSDLRDRKVLRARTFERHIDIDADVLRISGFGPLIDENGNYLGEEADGDETAGEPALVRGPEVRELLNALNTGHQGGCGTVHANSATDVVARVEALGALAGLSREAVQAQLCLLYTSPSPRD